MNSFIGDGSRYVIEQKQIALEKISISVEKVDSHTNTLRIWIKNLSASSKRA